MHYCFLLSVVQPLKLCVLCMTCCYDYDLFSLLLCHGFIYYCLPTGQLSRGIMPIVNRLLISRDNDHDHDKELVKIFYGKKSIISGSTMIPIIFLHVLTIASWWSSSLSLLISNLLTIGIIPLDRWLNSSVAGLDSLPGPIGFSLICNKATYVSTLLSLHFLIVYFINLKHIPTWPLH